jgi:hypothetical protein
VINKSKKENDSDMSSRVDQRSSLVIPNHHADANSYRVSSGRVANHRATSIDPNLANRNSVVYPHHHQDPTVVSGAAAAAAATNSSSSFTMGGGASEDRRTVAEFVHLLDKSKQLFNGLRELPQYGHQNNQWQAYFGRTFDVYTKLWKFQQDHRQVLEQKYNLKRWQIGDIASKIGQLYYHY